MEKQTTITLKGEAKSRRVWLNGKELKPADSLKIRKHSPDGFNWGYGGSGPAQLALAVFLELFGPDKVHGYQEFKWNEIAALPMDQDFEVEIDMTETPKN